MAELIGVPSDHVDAVWGMVEGYVKRALEFGDGEFWPEDIKGFCKSKDMQLWAYGDGKGVRGAGVTQIITYPRKKYVDMILWASDAPFEEWIGTLKVIEDGATALGAVPRLFGREGWKKRLSGYQRKYSVFVRTP